LVAAAGKDVLVDAEFAELVDDERDALALGVGEQVPHQRGLAGAEKAGDDGDGDFLGSGHAWAPLRGIASRRAKSSVSQPSSGPTVSQNSAPAARAAAANSVARWAGTADVWSPVSCGAPMMCGASSSTAAMPMPVQLRSLATASSPAPVASAVPHHQTCRAPRSAAGMPGSSG